MPTPHLQFPLSLASVRDRASSPYPTFSVLKSSLGLVPAGCRAQLTPYFSNLIDILSFLNKNLFGKSDAGVPERLTLWPRHPYSYPFLIFFNHVVNSKTYLSKALFKEIYICMFLSFCHYSFEIFLLFVVTGQWCWLLFFCVGMGYIAVVQSLSEPHNSGLHFGSFFSAGVTDSHNKCYLRHFVVITCALVCFLLSV